MKEQSLRLDDHFVFLTELRRRMDDLDERVKFMEDMVNRSMNMLGKLEGKYGGPGRKDETR